MNEWVGEVGGDGVLAAVRSAAAGIESGVLPGFSDREELLAYLNRPPAG